MTDLRTGGGLVLALLVGAVDVAMSASPPPQPPATAASMPTVPGTHEPLQLYSYDPGGRRDPFISLISRGRDLPSASERPDGLRGLRVNEVALRGVVVSGGSYLGVLEAPDNKTYIVRADDRLYDGSVKEILADTIVFLQEIDDPLSSVTERELRKRLRDTEEGR